MTSLAKDDGLVGSGMWSKVLTFIGSSLVGCGKCTLDYIPTECFALVHHGLAGSSFQPNLHHALVTFHYIGICAIRAQVQHWIMVRARERVCAYVFTCLCVHAHACACVAHLERQSSSKRCWEKTRGAYV